MSQPDKVWYRAVPGSRFTDKDASVIGPELISIVRNNPDETQYADVVAAAKRPRSPLHKYFEWDIKRAAEQHWLEQARYLTRSVLVCWVNDKRGQPVEEHVRAIFSVHPAPASTDETPKGSVRVFRTTAPGRQPKKLVTFDQVVTEKAYTRQVIEEARRALIKFQENYQWALTRIPGFQKEFRAIFRAIQKL